jgi:uncharacterized membrane protein YkoI
MKIKNLLALSLAAGLLAAGLTACTSPDTKDAKISKAAAQQIALARVPNGTIKESELEKEKGKLIWSFDIATPGTKNITEVNVDAITGEIVAVDIETPEKEKEEAEKEKK